MKRAFLAAASACAWLLASTADVRAATVFLRDGSLIHGTIVQLVEGRLAIKTGFAGTIEIAAAAIAGIDSEETLVVALSSGDRLRARLDYTPEDGQRLFSELLGDVPLADAEIARLWQPDAIPPALAEAQDTIEALELSRQEALAAADLARLEGAAALEEAIVTAEEAWSGALQLGASASMGNTDRVSFNGRAVANREVEFDRLDLSIEGRFSSENGEATENEVIASGQVERDFSKRLFAFGNLRLERDEFEDLDLRTILTGGLGYFLIREDTQQLKPRAGVGYQVEAFSDSSNNEQGLVTLGYDYLVEVGNLLTFTHKLTYFPTFTDPVGDYRLDSDAAFELPISESRQWRVRLGVRNQYDSVPQPGNEKLDTNYSVSIGYDFQ